MGWKENGGERCSILYIASGVLVYIEHGNSFWNGKTFPEDHCDLVRVSFARRILYWDLLGEIPSGCELDFTLNLLRRSE